MAVLVLANQEIVQHYDWYRITVYPLVYLAAGLFVFEGVSRGFVAAMLAVLALGGATATTVLLGHGGQPWMPPAVLLAVIIATVMAPVAVAAWRRDSPALQRAAKLAGAAAFSALLLANAIESWGLAQTYKLI